jgi:pSer/pThr/pTyr-binding forkhead associated (FHA) protein
VPSPNEALPPKTTLMRPAPPAAADVEPILVVVAGLEPGRRYRLERGETTIGRAAENHVMLHSPAVSSTHARVVARDGQFWIENLHSTNGVIVNDAAVSVDAPRLLSNGDAIRVSDHLLLFHHAGAQLASSTAIEIDRAEVARHVEELLKLVGPPRQGQP